MSNWTKDYRENQENRNTEENLLKYNLYIEAYTWFTKFVIGGIYCFLYILKNYNVYCMELGWVSAITIFWAINHVCFKNTIFNNIII